MYIRALENRACRQKAKDAKGTPHRSWAASKHLKDDIPGLSQRHLWVWLLSYVVNLNKIQVFKQTGLTETLPAQTKLDRNDSNGKKPLDTQTTASRNQAGKTTQLPTLMEEPEHSHRRPESWRIIPRSQD